MRKTVWWSISNFLSLFPECGKDQWDSNIVHYYVAHTLLTSCNAQRHKIALQFSIRLDKGTLHGDENFWSNFLHLIVLVVKAFQIMSGNTVVTVTVTCNKDRDHLQFAGRHELSAERNCITSITRLQATPAPGTKKLLRVLCRRCTVWFNIQNSPCGSTHPINPSVFSPQFSYFTLQVSPVALKLTAKVFCYQPSIQLVVAWRHCNRILV